MKEYLPDMYQKSIYTIDYSKLLSKGIKCILYDLDNTIVASKSSQPTEKAKDLFEHLEFEELIRVKYKVTVYSKDKVEYVFQDVENLGVLIEYENMNDFEGKSLDEINSAKNNMFEEIKNTGINLTEEKDVKKAYELILNKYFNK